MEIFWRRRYWKCVVKDLDTKPIALRNRNIIIQAEIIFIS